MSHCPLTHQQLQEVCALLRNPRVEYRGATLDPFCRDAKTAPSFASERKQVAIRTRFGWNSADAALYYSWCAFAPATCTHCGSTTQHWLPSVDDEYRCAACHSGAGSSATSGDVVDEMAEAEDDVVAQSDEDENDDGAETTNATKRSSFEQGVFAAIRGFLPVLRALDAASPDVVPVALYPIILRIACNFQHLVMLPDSPSDQQLAMRSTALFLACSVVIPARVSFPLLQQVCSREVKWLDVVHWANELGVTVDDFFDDPLAHMRNLMADLGDARPPHALWNLQDDVELRAHVINLKRTRLCVFSPDHSAAMVSLELCRLRNVTAETALDAWASAVRAKHGGVFARADEHAQLLFVGPHVSLLLMVFARHFGVHPIELCAMLEQSGLYGGSTDLQGRLQRGLSCGQYPVPLTTRGTPVGSPWEALYRAVHSEDRCCVLSVVSALSESPTTCTERPEITNTLLALLSKHGANARLTFNYCLRVEDETESDFNSTYYCSSVTPDGASFASFTKSLSVRYRSKTQQIYLNDRTAALSGRKRQTSQLHVVLLPPMEVVMAGHTCKHVIDLACHGIGAERWLDAWRRCEMRSQLHRRMRTCRSLPERVASAAAATRAPPAAELGVAGDVFCAPVTRHGASAIVVAARGLPTGSVVANMSDAGAVRVAAALHCVSESTDRPAVSPRHGGRQPEVPKLRPGKAARHALRMLMEGAMCSDSQPGRSQPPAR